MQINKYILLMHIRKRAFDIIRALRTKFAVTKIATAIIQILTLNL